MQHQDFQGLQAPSFASPVELSDLSETLLSGPLTDENRTEADYRTWNWQEAADELGIKESTLRRRWWQEKLEPVYRHCPTPLRVITRTTPTRQIEEFTAFGIEVLKAYQAALAKGERAAELMLAEARTQYPEPSLPPQSLTDASSNSGSSVASSVEIEMGNHRIVVAPPELFQTYTLDSLRKVESLEIEDPMALANQFLSIADQLQGAMQADIEQREEKLRQTRQAKNVVAAKAQELKLEKRLYQERANQVGVAQTEETQALQDALSALQVLGKSSASPDSPGNG